MGGPDFTDAIAAAIIYSLHLTVTSYRKQNHKEVRKGQSEIGTARIVY